MSRIVELLVLEGIDAGRLFTLSDEEVPIARINPGKTTPGAIQLADPTVSLRQATVRLEGGEHYIEHHPGATNPTTVNGKPIIRERIMAGDCIGMGRVLLEVRERPATLFGLATRQMQLDAQDTGEHLAIDGIVPDTEPSKRDTGAHRATELRPIPALFGQLTVVSSAEELEQRIFSLNSQSTQIGRSSQCEITIPEGGVSRIHAEIVIEGEAVELIHRSGTNSTSVNGVAVTDRTTLSDGDQIQLADRVTLRFDAPGTSKNGPDSHEPSLWSSMEEGVQLQRKIEEDFGTHGSFLDIDVVGSYALKAEATQPGHIVVSFQRWRAWVEEVLARFDGELLNSNGDELMCFFESPLQAVRAASHLLADLERFNSDGNLLTKDFQLRMGIHTGHSLVDRTRGVAYSQILDLAGHLQKQSLADGLLISSDTFEDLPAGLPFEPAGPLEKSGIATYRLTGKLD